MGVQKSGLNPPPPSQIKFSPGRVSAQESPINFYTSTALILEGRTTQA